MDIASAVTIFLVLLLLLAFFAGTEIPLMSVSEHKLDVFLKERRFGAKALRNIKKNSERLLIVNLVGTTIVTIAISSFSTVMAIAVAENSGLPENQAVSIAVFVASAIILFVGEISPKILGVRFTDSVALKVAPLYEVLLWIFRPLNFVIEFFVKFLNFISGWKGELHSKTISAEELEAFIDLSREGGAVEDHEHRKIKGILDLSETDASSVMTPRVNVEFIPSDTTVDEAIGVFLESSHTRLPVYEGTPDSSDYVITLREVVAWQKEWKGETKLEDLDLEKIIKIPVTKPLDTLFEVFQKSRRHIALVLDEHGGVAGVVTMEDIIEEVFGDIKDEKDREAEYMRFHSDGSIQVQGGVLIDDILEELDIDDISDIGLEEEMLGETVSYVIISLLERFPDPNETLTIGNGKILLSLQVQHVADGKIEDLKIRKIVH